MRIILTIILLTFFSCRPTRKPSPVTIEPLPIPPLEKIVRLPYPGFSPIVRIGLAETESVSFETPLPFRIYKQGNLILEAKAGIYNVKIKETSPALFDYYAVLSEVKKMGEARKIKEEFESNGCRVKIKRVGVFFEFDDKQIDNRVFLILQGPFSSEKKVRKMVKKNIKGVISLVHTPPYGKIILEDFEGKVILETEGFFRILPGEDKPQRFTIFDLPTGEDFSWSKKRTLNFNGILEFRVSNRGNLLIINELPLEEYLKGVLPSEMGADFPLEALKAQAVIARTLVFSLWGKKYALIGEPYDFSDDIYFQVFSGITFKNNKTNNAVMKTRGKILFFRDNVAETPYHSVCGGHTESSKLLWGKVRPYLEGIPDITPDQSFNYDLTKENDVRKWLLDSPSAYCSPLNPFPLSAKYAKSNFRWKIIYKRKELEKIIKRKTGRDLGTVLSIIPLRRGKSGRILELLIKGTKGNFLIRGELEIRKALSSNYLKSSLFIVNVSNNKKGIPKRFILVGGGFGHGVGLCQIGASVRAQKGENYEEILRAYFPGTYLKKIY